MFLGVEIGGTKIQVGVGPGDGTLTDLWRGSVDRERGAALILQQIESAVPPLMARAGVDVNAVRGIGIGFGGPVDDETRSVLKSHQVGGWDGFPLGEWAERTFGWPCAVGNDADVAGLGEAIFGAGRNLSPLFYVTIGSGIGGGLIIDRRIYRGAGKGAAEIGHLRMPTPDGFATLESLCSGWAIERGAKRTCAELAVDPAAAPYLAECWTYLTDALCHVIALVCPRRIIIGGGVSLMGDALFVPLRRMVAERVFAPFADCYDIVPAALGEEVVVHGALALAALNRLP